MICRGQVITAGMGGVIDINILAIEAAMRIYGIRNQSDCLEKTMHIFHKWHKYNKLKDGEG